MSLTFKRLVSIVASTALLSLVSAAANAQTKFHSQFDNGVFQQQELWFSQYTFQSSMILNSIGFYTNGQPMDETSYKINGDIGERIPSSPSASVDSDGFRWLEFSGGLSVNAGTILRVYTQGYNQRLFDGNGDVISEIHNPTELKYTKQPYNFSAQEISWDGSRNRFEPGALNQSYTNSNIRVTNPGSNVAPEPGSFALALTGGAALIGICIRRRRNAG